jgi:hypothetical protein
LLSLAALAVGRLLWPFLVLLLGHQWGLGRRYGLFLGLLGLFLALLSLIAALTRLAWRQLAATRRGLYRRPPYSGSVARLAIQLRKSDLLKSLHLSESNAVFLGEEHGQDQPPRAW